MNIPRHQFANSYILVSIIGTEEEILFRCEWNWWPQSGYIVFFVIIYISFCHSDKEKLHALIMCESLHSRWLLTWILQNLSPYSCLWWSWSLLRMSSRQKRCCLPQNLYSLVSLLRHDISLSSSLTCHFWARGSCDGIIMG